MLICVEKKIEPFYRWATFPNSIMKRRTGLSKTQSIRYGGLVAVMCGRTPYPFLLDNLREGEFVLVEDRSNSKMLC